MMYSCGYWEQAQTLEEAQLHKLQLICRKLQLKPGERLLDIGCGWGGLARYAATEYGVEVVGITVSREQQKLAQERCAGLPVTIELTDYRDLTGQIRQDRFSGNVRACGAEKLRYLLQYCERSVAPGWLVLIAHDW